MTLNSSGFKWQLPPLNTKQLKHLHLLLKSNNNCAKSSQNNISLPVL